MGLLDLNLLKVFLSIHETGSVTAAGERLGLAQSSISHSLRRLRSAFGDQLFVRTTTGMQPTPLAQHLHGPISASLVQLQDAFDQSGHFHPLQSTRTFNIVMTDVCELMFLPRLRARLEEIGSGVTISVLQMPRAHYRDALEQGTADLAIGQLPQGHTDFLQQHLFDESFACFVRAGHPLAKGMTIEDFFDADHLIVGPPAMAETHIRKALGPRANRRRIAVQVRHYLAAPFIVEQTNLIALLPRTVSDYAQRMGTLVELPPPVDVPPIVMRQFWHERSNHDSGCRWLRSEIARLFRKNDNVGHVSRPADPAAPLAV
ncbi:MAG: LysR family transcriptional regulator [Sphingomonas sp.]